MKNLKHIILVILTILPIALMGIPIINAPTIKNGTCRNNGEITVNISGAGTLVVYGLKGKTDQIGEIKSQTSNVFTDLPAGDYIISVYDNTTGSEPVTREATVTTTYKDFAIKEPVATQGVCGGSLRLTVTGGSAPYLYRIKNLNDGEIREFTSSNTAYQFTDLPAGKYYSEIVDKCGEMRVAQGSDKSTINEGVLNNVVFNSVDYVGVPILGLGTCNAVYISAFSSYYRINGSNALNSSTIRYRMEYPVGSGTFTSWVTGSSNHYFYNYDPINPGKYRLQAEHPCTKELIFGPDHVMPQAIIDFSLGSTSYVYKDFCTLPTERTVVVNLNTSGISNYMCDNYTIVATPNDGGTPKDYVWASGSSFALSNLKTETAYTVVISKDGTVLKTLNITAVTPSTYAFSTFSNTNSMGYNHGTVGDFNTTGISTSYSAPSNNSINLNNPITYTIVEGPTTARAPITIPKNSNGNLWKDLPFGKYKIQVNYNNCRTETAQISMDQVVTGFDAVEPTFTEASVCGQYNLKVKGYFLDTNNSPYTSYTAAYNYNIKITNLDTGTFTISNRLYSNIEATVSGTLAPGRYKLQYYCYYNNSYLGIGGDIHYYKEQTITLPEYRAPWLYIPLSGGITCGDEEGTLTLATRGSRPPYLHRYKDYAENDDPTSSTGYGPWTANNVFTGLKSGRFTIQISDNCGSVTRENIKIYSGTEQFVSLIGAFDENTVCQGKSGLISVLSIGPVESYQWYKNGVKIEGATTESYSIPDMQLVNEGTYKVEVYTGVCTLSSEIPVKMLPMISANNDSITVLPFEQRIFDVYANDLIAMCHPEICDQILSPDKIQVEGYPVGVLEGKFGKIEFVNNKIKYTAPEHYEGGVVRFTHSVSCSDNGVPYDGKGQVSIFILQSCTLPTVCYGEGFEVCFKDYPAGRTSYDIVDKNGTTITLPKIYTSLLADEVLKVTPKVDGKKFPTIDFTIHVIPNEPTTVRWKGAIDHYWNNPRNWVAINSNGTDGNVLTWIPNDCVDAEIPTASPRYPKLSTAASINNLFMRDRAMLAYSHKLAYNSVEVDVNFSTTERDRWVMYSAPLAGMYSGDFMLRKSTNAVLEEGTYMTFFQSKNPDDGSSAKAKTISRVFANMEQKLPLGKSFFLKMNSNTDNISQYSFPKGESKYTYYKLNNWSTTYPAIVETKPLERSIKGRFIADVSNIDIDNSYTITPVDDIDNTEVVMVSNPFPAYLDIKKFLEANSTALEQGYLIWTGTEDNLMKYNQGRGNTWTIQDINLIKNNAPSVNEYIAPFQSFLVVKKVKENKVSLIFKPEEMTTVEPIGISGDYILK